MNKLKDFEDQLLLLRNQALTHRSQQERQTDEPVDDMKMEKIDKILTDFDVL